MRQFLLFFLLFSYQTSFTQSIFTLDKIPNPKTENIGYVSDPTAILSIAETAIINSLCTRIEDSGTAQIAVVLLPSIGVENPKDFAIKLFNFWSIGQDGIDNGLLILTIIDQRRTEFETGYGMESVLPDVYCYRIGMQELVPYFKQGEYGQGVIAAVTRIETILNDPSIIQEWRTLGSSDTKKRRLINTFKEVHIILGGYLCLTFLLIWIFLHKIRVRLQAKTTLHEKYKHLHNLSFYVGGFSIIFPLCIFIYIFIRRKKHHLRQHPRYSKSGKLMRKLSEAEEDQYLKKGQIREEELKSVDYDVWVTEDGIEHLILKYDKYSRKYLPCEKCTYKTNYLVETKRVRDPTTERIGLEIKYYECKNCGFQKEKAVTIPILTPESISGVGGFGGSSSSGGGSSWGGGSSGGGGGGVSW